MGVVDDFCVTSGVPRAAAAHASNASHDRLSSAGGEHQQDALGPAAHLLARLLDRLHLVRTQIHGYWRTPMAASR